MYHRILQRYIFTGAAYTRTVNLSIKKYHPIPHLTFSLPGFFLAYAMVMFVLSTHTRRSRSLRSSSDSCMNLTRHPEGLPVLYRINVFPKKKAIYTVNVCALLFSSPVRSFDIDFFC